jgi:hypothetical protein|tara:strand:+ start:1835 stop:2044 length:210 start_codon:yes stop_codon:yes gene_type:complete
MIKTSKINMVINLCILALLIYLSVAVHQLQEKVFPDPNIMIPLAEKNITNDEFENAIKNFLMQKLSEIE